jgi:hypothetical protein
MDAFGKPEKPPKMLVSVLPHDHPNKATHLQGQVLVAHEHTSSTAMKSPPSLHRGMPTEYQRARVVGLQVELKEIEIESMHGVGLIEHVACTLSAQGAQMLREMQHMSQLQYGSEAFGTAPWSGRLTGRSHGQ